MKWSLKVLHDAPLWDKTSPLTLFVLNLLVMGILGPLYFIFYGEPMWLIVVKFFLISLPFTFLIYYAAYLIDRYVPADAETLEFRERNESN